MDRPPARIEVRSSDSRGQDQTIIVVSRPAGFFAKAVGVVAALLLLALTFVFSLLFFAILASVALVLLGYAWWLQRRSKSREHHIRSD